MFLAVGALMYLLCGTRSYLAINVGFVSSSLENPSEEHIVGVKILDFNEFGIILSQYKFRI